MPATHQRQPVFVIVRIGGIEPETLQESGWRRLGRASHPGLASLGATIATGRWPEIHGVVRGLEPHPDRLSFASAMPEHRGVAPVWTEVVRNGGRAAVVGWTHATGVLPEDEAGRLSWTEVGATAPRSGEPPESPVLTSQAVRPEGRRGPFLERRRETTGDLVLETLEEQAADAPDLLMGMLLDADPEDSDRRLEGIVERFAAAQASRPIVVELLHPMPARSIMDQRRFGPSPWIRITGTRARPEPARPRVAAVAGWLRSMMGLDPVTRIDDLADGSGFGPAAIDELGSLPLRRLSVYQLKSSELDLHREIGLSLLARGERRAARAWLGAALEDQHGRLDRRLASLLLSLADPAERSRMMPGLRGRFGPLGEDLDGWFDGRSAVEPDSLRPLGPFVGGQFAKDLRRQGRLAR